MPRPRTTTTNAAKRKRSTSRPATTRAPAGVKIAGASTLAYRSPSYGPKSNPADLHYFKKMCLKSTITLAVATAWQSNAFDFELGDLSEAATFASLFDFYRITRVDLTFMPQYQANVVNSGGASPFSPMTFFTTIDNNDITAPASAIVMMENPTTKFHVPAGKPWKRTVYPRIQGALYNGATSSATLETDGPRWISTTNTTAQHYGLKWGVTAQVSSTAETILVYGTYYLEFKASV